MTIDNQFIHEHTALVKCIARQYNIPSIPQEDLVLQKTQKKCIDVGKFMQKCVNK